MNHKVIKYYPQPYGEYQLGYCKVDMSGKCRLILKVVKNKAGHVYCTSTSCKIGEEWQSSFYFVDRDCDREFLDECQEQLKPLMEPAKQEPAPHYPSPAAPGEDNPLVAAQPFLAPPPPPEQNQQLAF